MTRVGVIGAIAFALLAWIGWQSAFFRDEVRIKESGARETKPRETTALPSAHELETEASNRINLNDWGRLGNQSDIESLIKKPLERLRKIATDFESRRTHFSQMKRPNGDSILRAVISPPAPSEIESFQSALQRELAAVPAEAQSHLLVDAIDCQDELLNPTALPKVLFVLLTEDAKYGGERTFFWEFDTSNPHEFVVDGSGNFSLPGGQDMPPGRRWRDRSYHTILRFRHLVRFE